MKVFKQTLSGCALHKVWMFCNDFNNRRSRLNDNKNIKVKIKVKIVRQISVIDTLEKLRKEI